MAKLVSSTYGDALFELALEENRMDEINEEIVLARQVFLENEELFKLLNHPKIVKEEKLSFIGTVFQGKLSEEVLGLSLIHI